MIKTLDTSMLNVRHDIRTLAPLCAEHGIQALSAHGVLENKADALEAHAILKENGLTWGLMPMPADFYHWDLDDTAFEAALKELGRRAAIAEKVGIRHAYNHVWSSGPREYGENFAWHVQRIRKVSHILHEHGIRYGLEFLGPHHLLSLQTHPFIHSLTGVLSLVDAAGGVAGVAFDTFHWYCSHNGDPDELLYMEQHIDRLVMLHMNDAVAGLPYNEQQDLERRLPMETGIINTKEILSRFRAKENNALYMIEPFEPGRSHFGTLSAEQAVKKAAEIFARVEND